MQGRSGSSAETRALLFPRVDVAQAQVTDVLVGLDSKEIWTNPDVLTKELNAQVGKDLKSIGIQLLGLVYRDLYENKMVNKDITALRDRLKEMSEQLRLIEKEIDSIERAHPSK